MRKKADAVPEGEDLRDLSARARITLLVVIAALPSFILIVVAALLQRDSAEAEARAALVRTASFAARQQERTVDGVRITLAAAVHALEELHTDRASCDRYLAGVLGHSAGLYHSMGLFHPDGHLLCNAMPVTGVVRADDRRYFREALAIGKFAIGEYQIGRVTRLEGVNFGFPVEDEKERKIGVAFIGMNLANFNRIVASTQLPSSAVMTVVDRGGIVLARQPAAASAIGRKLRDLPGLERGLSGASGVFEGVDTAKVRHLFAYDTVATDADGTPAIQVLVQMPLAAVYAEAGRAALLNLAGLFVGTLLLLVVGWYGAELLILRTLRSLLGAARRVRGGDLGVRTGLHPGRDELAQLGVEFDLMAEALQRRDDDLNRALKEKNAQAMTDSLTGLLNRRYLDEYLPREIARALRSGEPFALLMFDLDHFKAFNDNFGHEAGDRVLQELATLLHSMTRSGDVACRYGGEEFVLIMHRSTLDIARRRAEDIRAAVSKLDLVHRGRSLGHLTVSIGLAAFPGGGNDAEAMLRAADTALYAAKHAGRDRVAVASSEQQGR